MNTREICPTELRAQQRPHGGCGREGCWKDGAVQRPKPRGAEARDSLRAARAVGEPMALAQELACSWLFVSTSHERECISVLQQKSRA